MTVAEAAGIRTTKATPRAPAAQSAGDATVELAAVTVRYGRTTVLDELDLTVPRGEFLALLGPSGSGKTTVIRTIAGFIHPVAGTVQLAGIDVTTRPPHRRGTGVVFQSYALFPHMSVKDNLAYPLKTKGMKRAAITRRCDELLELVRMPGLGDVRPSRLSGGQQQRVALARALAMEPEVLLLDEPLSNLDANLRTDVGAEIRRLQQTTGTTALMVTHDRREAFAMADRIAVLRGGRIEQLGSPADLYRQPKNRFMAEFVGDANFVPGTVTATEDGFTTVRTPLGAIRVAGTPGAAATVDILIRPEDIAIVPDGAGAAEAGMLVVEARVRSASYFGSSVAVDLAVGDQSLSAVSTGSMAAMPAVGDSVRIAVRGVDCVLVPVGDSP